MTLTLCLSDISAGLQFVLALNAASSYMRFNTAANRDVLENAVGA